MFLTARHRSGLVWSLRLMSHEPIYLHPIPSPIVTPQSLSADAGLYCALFETAPDAIVVVADDGTIILVNAQTEQLFGYTRT